MKARAHVVSVGARTSLGQTALQTAMLYRAGCAGLAAAPLLDLDGDQVTMCFDPTLPPLLVGWERAVQLAVPALDEALAPLAGRVDGSRVQVSMCIDERYGTAGRGSADADAGAALVAGISDLVQKQLPGASLEVTARGNASAAVALGAGIASLEGRQRDALVLGAVHSDYDPPWIQGLSEKGRLFKPDNLDSFIPGELAVFLVLMREDVMRRAGLAPLAGVASVASGHETATPDNDQSAYDAKGLTHTVRDATAILVEAGLSAGWAITDLTFEQRRMHEWQSMLIRTRKVWSDPYVVESPAQRMGNLGAAAMPLGMALAATGWRCRSAPAPIAVVFAGSDAGTRGAVVLATP
ncbi:MAG: hypothetical protein DRI90_13040 [Deltaproteobacteria bacterium]|nr:MAG: hypothetical protein DRI90_13040 [Deltaproteobacteria bacterium]